MTFKPGTTSLTVSVPITPETQAKANETFQVNLSSAAGANIGTASGTGTIVDTFGAPTAPPVANNISTVTTQGTAVTLNVLASATDPNNFALSLASFTQAGHGTVTKNSDGTLTYSPTSSYLGADSFTYTVSDSNT